MRYCKAMVRRGWVANQRGSVMMEGALILPLLMLLSAIALEGGNLFTQYLQIAHVAYEGSRLASKVSGLETDLSTGGNYGTCCSTTGTSVANCSDSTVICPSPNTGFLSIAGRVYTLTRLADLQLTTAANRIRVKIAYDKPNDDVTLTLTIDHQLLWGFLGLSYPLSVTVTTPYLY